MKITLLRQAIHLLTKKEILAKLKNSFTVLGNLQKKLNFKLSTGLMLAEHHRTSVFLLIILH